MNLLLLEKLNAHPELLSDQADQQYTITGVIWQAYEALLSDLGDDFPGLRDGYERRERSELLPALDLSLLATCVLYPELLDALIEFLQALRSTR